MLKAINAAGMITAGTVPLAFKAADEHALLMKAVEPHLVKMMATGAAYQLAVAEQAKARAKAKTKQKGRSTKAASPLNQSFDDSYLAPFNLPEDVKKSIVQTFAALEKQDYWLEIQAATERHLTEVIRAGIEEGLNMHAMAKRINESLGGLSKVRSMAIARTETTGAFNAGHEAAYQHLASSGFLTGKTWSASEKDARETHAVLNGVTVGTGENFLVGGAEAPYPGHPSLPAAERCNCRCTTVGEFNTEAS